MINPFTRTVTGQCPGGFCNVIVAASEAIVVLLLVLAFLFAVTLIPQEFLKSFVESKTGRLRS